MKVTIETRQDPQAHEMWITSNPTPEMREQSAIPIDTVIDHFVADMVRRGILKLLEKGTKLEDIVCIHFKQL